MDVVRDVYFSGVYIEYGQVTAANKWDGTEGPVQVPGLI